METLLRMEGQNAIYALKSLRCGQNLSPQALQVLAGVSIRKKVAKNRNVWSMGDPGEFVAIILSGAVEVTKVNADGGEKCLGIFGRSDAIGISAAIRKVDYPATARSIAPNTEVLKLYLRPVLQSPPEGWLEEISLWLRELLLSHEQILRDKIDVLSAGRVEQRLMELFRQLIGRFGERSSRADYFIPVAFSKTQISKLIEVRTETVIRALSEWQKRDLVKFQSDGIMIKDWDLLSKEIEQGE